MIYNEKEYVYYVDIMSLYPFCKFEYSGEKIDIIKKENPLILCPDIEFIIIHGKLYLPKDYFLIEIKPILDSFAE